MTMGIVAEIVSFHSNRFCRGCADGPAGGSAVSPHAPRSTGSPPPARTPSPGRRPAAPPAHRRRERTPPPWRRPPGRSHSRRGRGPPRRRTKVLSAYCPAPAQTITGESSRIMASGPCLHLARGTGFGPQTRQFLQLQRALGGDRGGRTAADEQRLAVPDQPLGDRSRTATSSASARVQTEATPASSRSTATRVSSDTVPRCRPIARPKRISASTWQVKLFVAPRPCSRPASVGHSRSAPRANLRMLHVHQRDDRHIARLEHRASHPACRRSRRTAKPARRRCRATAAPRGCGIRWRPPRRRGCR